MNETEGLRDFFAGCVIAGCASQIEMTKMGVEYAVANAYWIADAMLDMRKRKDEDERN